MSSRKKEPRRVVAALEAGDSWTAERELTAVPDPASEYGFHTGKERYGCTREELVFQCCAAPATPLVWTPETSGMAPPESVPFLVQELARDRLQHARRQTRWSALSFGGALVLFVLWSPSETFRSLGVLLTGLLAVWLVFALHEWREALRTDATAFPAERAQLKHALWIEAQPAHYTKALLGVLIVVYVAEMITPRAAAIQAAGLVKPAVRDGEWWRLLTGPLLHAHTAHIWMNAGALLSSGRLIEVHSRREYLPLTFLVAALVGSVFSFVAYPEKISVGASGGIMGLIGFLLVLGYRRRGSLPPGFAGGILVSLVATVALGVVAIDIIDNAAHLGGLIGGALVGSALERRGLIDPAESSRSRLCGNLASAAIVAAALIALFAMRA